MDDRGKISFDFDRIEADLLGFKVPLPKFNSDAGFVEVQVRFTRSRMVCFSRTLTTTPKIVV